MSIVLNLTAIRDVSVAAATDPHRFALSCVHIEDEGLKRHYVATDGRRLFVHTQTYEGDSLGKAVDFPMAAFGRDKRTAKQRRALGDDAVEFERDGAYFISRAALRIVKDESTGLYPNWRAVFPKGTLVKAGYLSLNLKFFADALTFLGHNPKKSLIQPRPFVLDGIRDSVVVWDLAVVGGRRRALVMPIRADDEDEKMPKIEGKAQP